MNRMINSKCCPNGNQTKVIYIIHSIYNNQSIFTRSIACHNKSIFASIVPVACRAHHRQCADALLHIAQSQARQHTGPAAIGDAGASSMNVPSLNHASSPSIIHHFLGGGYPSISNPHTPKPPHLYLAWAPDTSFQFTRSLNTCAHLYQNWKKM